MPTEIKIEAEKSFIGGWLLDDITVCDKLIDHFESVDEKVEGRVSDGKSGWIVDKSIKDSIDLNLDASVDIVSKYAFQLQQVCNAYTSKYPYSNNTSQWIIERATLQKYNPYGGFFSWHTERSSAAIPSVFRHLVFMTYLNDVTDAGETEFFHQNIKVKPKKGLTLIWPADWTHTHRGIPSNTQVKYIITGWYIFIDNV